MRTTISVPEDLFLAAKPFVGKRSFSQFAREAIQQHVERLERERLAREMEEGYRSSDPVEVRSMPNLPSQSHSVDVAPISSLIALIRARCNPLSVWLFGSRAIGSPREDSDWDLLVVLPDDVSDEQMFADNPPSKFGRMTNVNADIIYCNETEVSESTSVPNTLAYEVARTGVEIA